ncbi:MAG: D-aminoacylase [Anaerolineae bacterium]|nr:D-aminoacylase [Anaerolineae bacterium]
MPQQYDVILRNGTLYDGSGNPPVVGDLAIQGDTIAAIGQLPPDSSAEIEIDASGLAVAPGFINMLSWATESLIEDGRSQSEIRQGVTLEVMGEDESWGPLNEAMKETGPGTYLGESDIHYDIEWNTLSEYLEYLEKRGVSCNVASFVGLSTLRVYVIGYEDRHPTHEEMHQMQDLLRQAMEEGAMGLSAALIYAPSVYTTTDEIKELAKVVAGYDGMYISHLRSEGSAFLEAVDEFLDIVDEANVTGEIYHLKAAGRSNWDKMDQAIDRIEDARANGLHVVADMYTYPYSGTGLDACLPPWAHDGGHNALMERLRDPETRERIKADMVTPSDDWENMFVENSPENILVAGFKNPALRHLQGKRLSEVIKERGTSAKDTVLDLILEDNSRIFTMYFSMSEDNLRKQVALPWVAFCSDGQSMAPEGVFLNTIPHPRAYGSFARVLGKYTRDEKVIPLEEAVRRLSAFPAANLKIEKRGWLREGYYADVVVFDPEAVQDHATPENPHQYATGMVHVFVNGAQVLKDAEHTGATPGRVVRGPGYQKQPYTFDYPEAFYPLMTLGGDYDGNYHEFHLGKQYIPDLIRLATDRRLLGAPDEVASLAPVHAWRRLAQLHVNEAIEPLISLLDHYNPFVIMEEMPTVMGMFGTPAITPLKNYLEDASREDVPRSLAGGLLIGVGRWNGGLVYDLCESIVIQQLERYEQNSPLLNAFLIRLLNNAEADIVELVTKIYMTKQVDTEVAGSWDEMQIKLGLRSSPELSRVIEEDELDEGDEERPVKGPSIRRRKKKSKKKR